MATADSVMTRRTTRPRNWARLVRKMHLYLGTFFAPAILFFAISGGLQTFSWHERTPGSNYQPPVWIQKMAQLHKKQSITLPVRRPPANAGRPGANRPRPEQRAEPTMPVGTLMQKWFVFLMSLGLVFTTLLGLYMAFKFNPRTPAIWISLVVGALLPIAFALLS